MHTLSTMKETALLNMSYLCNCLFHTDAGSESFWSPILPFSPSSLSTWKRISDGEYQKSEEMDADSMTQMTGHTS